MALALSVSSWHCPPAVPDRVRAFTATVREHEDALLGIARKLCRNSDDAHDLVQNTYERALRNWDRYGEQGNARAWLVAIMHNLFIDHCRAQKRRGVPAELPPELPQPEPSVPPQWTRLDGAQVNRALETLGADFRQVYELHAAGKSYDEIAATLKIAKATVGTRLLRARHKLRDQLQRELDHG
ncbi:MAG TPA: RNA polymerase sigma factor [Kofleriaceae bacterium]